MPQFQLKINDTTYTIEADREKPLLWVLRDDLNLTGSKYGCGIGQCGACTVHLNGTPIRSCSFPVSKVGNNDIVTIEGLATTEINNISDQWVAHNVPQCGFCQTGQIMSAIALLRNNPNPTDEDIDAGMSGNFCRCGTYFRIRKAIKSTDLKR